ncbi:MAG: hypothetical protein ACI8RD_011963, partial [Bacillariaceae sp.]
ERDRPLVPVLLQNQMIWKTNLVLKPLEKITELSPPLADVGARRIQPNN